MFLYLDPKRGGKGGKLCGSLLLFTALCIALSIDFPLHPFPPLKKDKSEGIEHLFIGIKMPQ
jgi:hypothetical protein